ncbi:glycosyltransferase family 4 protein [Mucilaginibacter sp. L3T2-6]|uniref:glycosyltransferase family 4 protein n=1 Tax=Mucilaginibacter sp. L3T2-6 TaxID=3062491 RepID=UPI002674AFB7|nr:glycosyltransferase family 4 protein [Mucilaginibacter sp. L3T2-6]MDO3643385.1 glycosyltransferase family 4 protein [Mucilaginibacter sp. L3T2-6]MDV6215682.1 glycosyltransferase family 4 protein [Mucilaginibacter sp. L3T2-6]
MRYVSLIYDYSPGFTDPKSWIKRIAAYSGILEELAKKNEVIAINRIDYEGEAIINGVEHKFVSFNKQRTHFPFRLNRFVKKLSPDIVIVQGLHNPLAVIFLRIILPKHVKIIMHHHAEKPKPGIKRYAQKLADWFVDAYLFASTELGLDWVKKGVIAGAGKICEVMEVSSIFYPIDKSSARQQTGITGSPVFLWVGTLDTNKDPVNVVKAFLKYSRHNKGARLYMLYHETRLLSQIRELIASDTAGAAITFVGQKPHEELLYWFNSADIFISGSYYEGSGTAVCEAMSCGCFPLVTDIPSFRMITDGGRCGLLYPPGDEQSLISALKETEKINMAEKGALSLEHFKRKLSFEAIAHDIQQIAASLL